MFNHSKLIGGLVVCALAALALVSCGGGGSSPAPAVSVATSDLTVPVRANNVAAFANIPFTFPNGVPEFGTTATTSVTFTDTSTSPGFTIVSGSTTVTGVTTFGSCIFSIKTSTSGFLSVGQIITIPNCNARVQTVGKPANGAQFQGSVDFGLGLLRSAIVDRPFSIAPDGTVSFFGIPIGQVTLAFVTGGS